MNVWSGGEDVGGRPRVVGAKTIDKEDGVLAFVEMFEQAVPGVDNTIDRCNNRQQRSVSHAEESPDLLGS